MANTTSLDSHSGAASSLLLIVSIVLATLTEAIASTALVLGRVDVAGDIYATPDEFAWLDIGYTTFKMVGFLVAPWLLARVDFRRLIVVSTLTMGVVCALAATAFRLEQFVLLRAAQGLSGGILLVAAQTLVFLAYSKAGQPFLQSLFAMGAVVAPATIVPAWEGWLIDTQSWTWVFFSVVPLSLWAAGLLLIVGVPTIAKPARRPFDIAGISLISAALLCLTYLFSQGSRWNWFEEPHIVWLSVAVAVCLIAFFCRQLFMRQQALLDFDAFGSDDFCFALLVSFVAGAALFGTTFLIPNFAVSVLAFTPTEAGTLLLPGSAMFVGALVLAAYLIQIRRVPPFAPVPFGIGLIMAAMWMLSGSTNESGADTMTTALLLRGFGLGLLFLSITLVAFGKLTAQALPFGIALFNTCRQLGGLIGVATLQTIIDHNVASGKAILSENITLGNPILVDRLTSAVSYLTTKGLDTLDAQVAATSLLGKLVLGQASVLAFDTAFTSTVVFFAVAAPILVVTKFGLTRIMKSLATPTL